MTSAIKVFIIDHDESMLHAFARSMKAAGFRPVCVRTVEELLVQKLPVNNAVIVADVSTVRQFSESLPMELHRHERTLPVIYLTDYDTESIRDDARRVGAVAYFRKPVDQQALLDAITFSVQRRKVG